MNLIKYTVACAALSLLPLTAQPAASTGAPQAEPPAATKPAQLVPAGSEIDFTTKQMGVPVDGKFGKFTAQIVLDPKQPQTGSVAFEIDTGSARFGSAELDAEVRRWADELLAMSPTVLKLLKMSFDEEYAPMREYQEKDYLAEVNPGFFASGEQTEGANAFLEKRRPNFDPWR